MKRLFLILTILAVGGDFLKASPLHKAEVTSVVNDVRLAEPSSGERPAKVRDVVQGKASLNTGIRSLAEIIFEDKTLARFGANTRFSFEQGTRNMDLKYGTMLLQVPKNIGGATIRTASIIAAITGTTILMEYNLGHYTKVIVVEGALRIYLKKRPSESVLLQAGQMIFIAPNATTLPEPANIDLKRLVLTSKLIHGIVGSLDSGEIEGALLEDDVNILAKTRTSAGGGNVLQTTGQAAKNNPNAKISGNRKP
ncbi:MAG: FecR domain-containing protein [bacterium]